MRKISCILLIGAISLSTIACGNVGNESKNLENVQTTSQNQYNDAMERKTDDMFCDEACYYISTEKSKLDPIDGNIGDYESYYASLTDSYRIAE